MGKIIKLDKNLANQISAWEVIERPVSVVKELVENSIDAWATRIKVEIKEWWINQIIVQDNWDGISYDDLVIVFDKYTTSKIKSLQDLYNIMTFWFRWEALSSISSISKVEIITKTEKSLVAYSLKSIWWELWKIEEISWNNWTKIIVNDLFFNTPARLSYLKKSRTEYLKIYEFLQQISLSYPSIWFEFISDWKTVFNFIENQDLKIRIYNIFWDEFSSNLLDINFEITWLKISWYISDPKVSFTNKNKQILFVNKRIIKSPLISKSISQAYNRYIPHGNNPAYVLNLQVDPTQIDVNVHPRKMEVRFASENNVFRAFYHSIDEKLKKTSLISDDNSLPTTNSFTDNIKNESSDINFTNDFQNKKYYTWSWTKFKNYSPYKDITINPAQTNISDSIKFSEKLLDTNISNDISITPMWRIIWQLHNSYIIVETKTWMKILDQHALAERIIYEKLINNDKSFSVQWLLMWISINLLPKEISILEDNIDFFNQAWFDIEILWWWNIIINSIPDFIKKENIKDIFLWILEDIWIQNFKKSKTLQEVKNKIFAYTACRSAVKFWDKLSMFEMNKLLKDASLDYSSTCPHGRPVVFDISLDELKNKYER